LAYDGDECRIFNDSQPSGSIATVERASTAFSLSLSAVVYILEQLRMFLKVGKLRTKNNT
jgi:hypothetical protein